eukprot:TRINITY_DN1239_c3_g1_i1.p1 TRINITY_DN1239_c3_g1~~TRINITY_DN1239_c3_g1_i1.p1  ORF type:complete len:161 (+),score=4.13 TRINITY_DN1239_c3_g1_i1:307-789(+)
MCCLAIICQMNTWLQLFFMKKDKIDTEDVTSYLLSNELRKKGKDKITKWRAWWCEEEDTNCCVRACGSVKLTMKQSSHTQEEKHERFMWFGNVPTSIAKENSLSLYYSTVRSRVTGYMMYITLSFLSPKKALVQLPKYCCPKLGPWLTQWTNLVNPNYKT